MIGKVILLSSVGLMLVAGGIFVFPNIKNVPPIQWESTKLDVSVFQGGARSVSVLFTSSKNLDDVSIFITLRFA